MATVATTHPTTTPPQGIMAWLTTVDHKKIGIMYVITCFSFFVARGFSRGEFYVLN